MTAITGGETGALILSKTLACLRATGGTDCSEAGGIPALSRNCEPRPVPGSSVVSQVACPVSTSSTPR